ncbi:MAG: DUF2007 domain-containing protein [Planctomycetota bacterium]
MADDQELVTIEEFENSYEADLAKLALDNAGIKSVILGKDLAANLTYNSAIFNVEIQVMAGDAEKAKQVLAKEK